MCEDPSIKSTQRRDGKDEVTCFVDDLLHAIYIAGLTMEEDFLDDEIREVIRLGLRLEMKDFNEDIEYKKRIENRTKEGSKTA